MSVARCFRLAGAAVIFLLAASASDYFPDGVLGDTPKQHRFLVEWYTKHLAAMDEPSLLKASRADTTLEAYRFLWLRSFHHPISVRLEFRKNAAATLISKEAAGQGGYEPGKLIRNRTVRLSNEQAAWFRREVEELGLWKLPTKQTAATGLDGAEWIIEMVKDGRYHVIDRWSPPADDPIHQIGISLVIRLAKLKLLYEDVY